MREGDGRCAETKRRTGVRSEASASEGERFSVGGHNPLLKLLDTPALQGCKAAMPTPMFNFRLPKADADALRMVAKVYGAPNPSAFLREMVGAVISGEPKKTGDFLSKLMVKMGEQLAFEFAQKATIHAGQQVQRALKSPKATGRMKGRRHAA